MTLPTFIVIGPGKTGTTWLYQCLKQHPDIRMAHATKETLFFNDYYDRGFAWYEKFFEGHEGARAIGEVSNDYFFSEEAPARIRAALPDVKLISILRNPVDRLVSNYLFRRRQVGVEGNFEQTIESFPVLVARNFYDVYLKNWFACIPREQILIVLNDEIEKSPEELLARVYAFVGADPEFRPAVMRERVLAASAPRFAPLFHILRRPTRWLRRHDMHALLDWAKNSAIVTRWLTKPIPREETFRIASDTRSRLAEVFRPHIDRTEEMIGQDLSAWK